MGLLAILPVLAGGYLFAVRSPITRHFIHHRSDYGLYLVAAAAGSIMLAAGYLIVIAATGPVTLESLVARAGDEGAWSIAALVALPLGWLAGELTRLLPEGVRHRLYTRAIEYEALERVLLDSLVQDIPVRITLVDRKVYVGFVLSAPDPTVPRRWLRVLPLVSGYRDPDDLRYTFTTFYEPVYEAFVGEPVDTEAADPRFQLALPADRIASIGLFDFETYEHFQQQVPTEERA
jgi:hypothetical protein